jgi:hypothetical protein
MVEQYVVVEVAKVIEFVDEAVETLLLEVEQVVVVVVVTVAE